MKTNRVGTKLISNRGQVMTCTEYKSATEIIVQFEDGYTTTTTWTSFSRGKVKNPYFKSVRGVGFIGEGDFKVSENGKALSVYKVWEGVLERCYKPRPQFNAYTDCTVCQEWHNYQNFAKWYTENYYEVPGEKMNLDKDILVKGNTLYSPDTCIIAPQYINTLFTTGRPGEDLPLGVTRSKDKFVAHLNINKEKVYLGRFNTPEEAFRAYKEAKEERIKEVAWKYRYLIPIKLYDALMAYEVTD